MCDADNEILMREDEGGKGDREEEVGEVGKLNTWWVKEATAVNL